MVDTNKVDSGLRRAYANNLIRVSSLYWLVKWRLALVLTCVLYSATVVMSKLKRDKMYECVRGSEMVQVAMGSSGKCKYSAE